MRREMSETSWRSVSDNDETEGVRRGVGEDDVTEEV